GDMAARLSLNDREQGLFFEMLTGDGRPRHEPVEPGHVRIRYLGHACVLVETANLCILVDPLVGYPVGGRDPKVFSWHDLPERIDYVLLTHNHQDHVMLETLLPLRHRIGQVVVPRCADGTLLDPSLALALRHIGFQRVVELGELASIRDGDCEITGVPFLGEHGDLNILSKLCYHVRVGHRTILFAADSAALEPRVYEHVAAFLGPADVLFLGMECDGAPLSWLYGPLMGPSLTREMDSARRLSGSRCEQALHLLDSFRPKEVYVYAMGQEPWVEFISSIKYTEQSRPIVESNQFLVECQQRSIHAERLYASKQIIRELS
ncbi:MAG: fold metallo-hydrolase, partial [Polyangiaceae bacterium]|nr:fold metallo-hydrolase [Polyangiaceae bacterium]